MAFCASCGKELASTSTFCTSCGAKVESAGAQAQPAYPPTGAPTQAGPATQPSSARPSYPTADNPPYSSSHNQTPPYSGTGQANPYVAQPQFVDNDARDNKIMAAIAYILFFIPLIANADGKSRFVRYHTNQGTVLFVSSLALSVAVWAIQRVLIIVLAINWTFASLAGIISGLLGLAAGLVPLVLMILGIINAANEKYEPLPIIGHITLIQP